MEEILRKLKNGILQIIFIVIINNNNNNEIFSNK